MTFEALKSGILSTLRFTLLALTAFDYTKGRENIDRFMDNLDLSWMPTKTVVEAKSVETAELGGEFHFPLNLQNNHSVELTAYLEFIKSMRRNYKQRVLSGEGSKVGKHIILTPCTKNKSTEYAPMARRTVPQDYLLTPASVSRLLQVRASVWQIPGSGYDPSGSEYYAYDLYVRHPKTQLYRDLRKQKLTLPLREKLLSAEYSVDWFFLSGGYGLLHALEVGRTYQATFSSQIARNERIPCTTSKWRKVLPELLDEVFHKIGVESVHAFGSCDYMQMVRATKLFQSSPELFILKEGRATDFEVRRALVETVSKLFGER